MSLSSLREDLRAVIAKLRRAPYVDSKLVKEIVRDLQRALLRADVPVELILKLSRSVEKRVSEEELPPGFSRRDLAIRVVYEELVSLLGGERPKPLQIHVKPYVLMLVGIQGSGKTTSAAKLAAYLRKKGYAVAMVCADNFRPGAYAQLKQLGDKIGVPVYGDPKAKDAVKIAEEGVKLFVKQGYDVIIVDTAGRHKDEEGLIEEMREIAEKVKPHEIMLVLDATMGKAAGRQAEAFNKATPIGSIFLTKLDGSARGGGALAAVVKTGAAIKFIGTGEKIDDIEEFNPQGFIGRLLGMGDLQALIRRFEEQERIRRKTVEAILSGKMTLLDLREQLEATLRMGPLRKIFELIPGFAMLPEGVEEAGEDKLRKWLVIMNSMTQEELVNPDLIDRSRIKRIARGAGVTPKDVRDLLDSYRMMKKYMRSLARKLSKGRIRGLRGLWGR